MKLSNDTLVILKNFSTINPGILFKAGSVLSTMSSQRNILADANIKENFPQDFGVYDLNNFLSVLSLYKDGADLQFDDKHVIIQGMGGRSKIKYRITDPSMIVIAPDRRPKLPSIDVDFSLTESQFNWMMKTAQVLSSPNIAVESDGESVNLVTFDGNNNAAHTNFIQLPEVESKGKVFKLVFKTENLKMLPGNYVIQISKNGISKFVSDELGLTYYVTLEMNSVYE